MTSVRAASVTDISAITTIYEHYVRHSTATFALDPVPEAEMRAGFDSITAMRLPYIVAEADGEIIGYAYASPFRPRGGYRHGAESTIYLKPGHTGKGVGKALLSRLIELATERGLYMMYAVVGDSENAASIALHKACGYVETGRLPHSGYKLGRWLDVVFMTKQLRPLGTPAVGDGWAQDAR